MTNLSVCREKREWELESSTQVEVHSILWNTSKDVNQPLSPWKKHLIHKERQYFVWRMGIGSERNHKEHVSRNVYLLNQ